MKSIPSSTHLEQTSQSISHDYLDVLCSTRSRGVTRQQFESDIDDFVFQRSSRCAYNQGVRRPGSDGGLVDAYRGERGKRMRGKVKVAKAHDRQILRNAYCA